MRKSPPSPLPTDLPRVPSGARWLRRLAGVAAALLVASSISLAGAAASASAAGTASISGVVTSAVTPGQPASFGTVFATQENAFLGRSTEVIGADGSYSITGLAAGSYTLSFSGAFNSGLITQWWNQKSDQASAVYFPVADGEVLTGFDATLAVGSSISGTITGTGSPGATLQNSTVQAFSADGSYAGLAFADAGGHYSLGGLVPGDYTVDFRGPTGSKFFEEWWNDQPTRATAVPIAVAAGQSVVNIDAELSTGASISGHVAGADAPGSGMPNVGVIVVDQGGQQVGFGYTDSAGNFTIAPVPSGSFTVRTFRSIQSPYLDQWWNLKPSLATADFFTVDAGQTVVGKDFVLPVGASISGSVMTGGAVPTPLPNATVFAFGSDGQQDFEGTSDSAGHYLIQGLPSDTYKIQFSAFYTDNYAPSWWKNATSLALSTPISVTSGQVVSGIDGVLEAGATISGTLGLAAGAGVALPPVEIDVVNADGSYSLGTITEGGGAFTITQLGAGSHTLHFLPYGGELADQWWQGAATAATATYFTVTTGETRTGFNATLALPGIVGATPTISGTATVGQTLTAAPGVWTPASVGFAYQWMRNGVAISGATAPTFALTAADLGAVISVSVTGSSAGYAPVTLTSDPTSTVGSPRVTSAVPTVTGTTRVGKTLTAHAGVWGPAPVSLTYRWSREGVQIAGANRATYELVNRDAGHTLTVTVTGTKRGFASGSVTSAPTSMITGGHLRSSVPHISGPARHGEKLTARAGSWGPGTVTLAYAWSRNGRPIAGATSSTYTLTGADVGTSITVSVTGSEPGFTTESRTSCSSGRIR